MKDKGAVAKLYRLERWLYCHKLKIMANIIYREIQILFSCVIPPTCKIGEGLHIAHGIGIVLHHNIEIGERCTIYQNVTIGGGDNIKIGDDFYIGANAVIVGKVNIGNNVKIGALTFVNFDVKDNCTVVGCKGKQIGGIK